MKLSSLFEPSRVVLGLKARTIPEAVCEILERVGGFHPSERMDAVIEAVLRRESQGSTAMEAGIAMPHARIPGLRDFYLMFAVAQRPLQEKGFDGRPVDVVILLVSNDKKNALMLQSMAAIARFALDEKVMAKIRAAQSPKALWRVVHETNVTVKQGMSARDLMKPTPVTAHKDMPLAELLDRFFESGVAEAPVCDESGKIIGAVTSAEIIEAGFPDYMLRMRDVAFLDEFEAYEQFFKREATIVVGDILDTAPLVVDVDDPLIHVVFRMKMERRPFALVEENGRLAGILDRNDVISRILRA